MRPKSAPFSVPVATNLLPNANLTITALLLSDYFRVCKELQTVITTREDKSVVFFVSFCSINDHEERGAVGHSRFTVGRCARWTVVRLESRFGRRFGRIIGLFGMPRAPIGRSKGKQSRVLMRCL